jgi:hypothetical protein
MAKGYWIVQGLRLLKAPPVLGRPWLNIPIMLMRSRVITRPSIKPTRDQARAFGRRFCHRGGLMARNHSCAGLTLASCTENCCELTRKAYFIRVLLQRKPIVSW